MERAMRLVTGLGTGLGWLGQAALAGMMLVTSVDVVFRGIGRPLWGLVEVVSLLAVLVLAAALPLTQRRGGHVSLDLLVRRLTTRTASLVEAGGSLACCLLFALVAWRMWEYGEVLKTTGEVTMSLELPAHLVVRIVAISMAALALTLLEQTMARARKAVAS